MSTLSVLIFMHIPEYSLQSISTLSAITVQCLPAEYERVGPLSVVRPDARRLAGSASGGQGGDEVTVEVVDRLERPGRVQALHPAGGPTRRPAARSRGDTCFPPLKRAGTATPVPRTRFNGRAAIG